MNKFKLFFLAAMLAIVASFSLVGTADAGTKFRLSNGTSFQGLFPNAPSLAPPVQRIYSTTSWDILPSGVNNTVMEVEMADEVFAGDWQGGVTLAQSYSKADPLEMCQWSNGVFHAGAHSQNPCNHQTINLVSSRYNSDTFYFTCLLGGAHWWGHRTWYRVYWFNGGWGTWYMSPDSPGTPGACV